LAEPVRTVTQSNGFALVAPSITRFNGGATGWDLRDPAPTITANSWITRPGGAAPLGIIAPALAAFYGHGEGRGIRAADLADPLRTVTVENRHALIAPSLISVAHGDSGGRREYPLSDPMGVVLAGGISNALIAPHVMTMRNAAKPFNGADEPTHTITAGGAGLSCVAPTLIQTGYGEAQGQAPRILDIGAPLGTVVAGGVKHAIAAPVLTYAQQGGSIRDVRDPVHTITASSKDQNSLITGWLAKWYGSPQDPRLDEPMHTVTTKPRFDFEVATCQAQPTFGPEHHARARQVASFLRAEGAWDGGEFVTLTIAGVDYVMTDIGMRMLTPRELFNAQGFPPDYVIEGVWEERDGDWHWKPFPKDVQVSCCGNSVCPDLARAIIAANCQHLMLEAVAA